MGKQCYFIFWGSKITADGDCSHEIKKRLLLWRKVMTNLDSLENPMDGRAWKAAVHGVAKSQTRLSNFTFTFHFHALEKEMATHSRYSCLENPRDGGAWWAAIYGVAQSRTWLKWLSSSSRLVITFLPRSKRFLISWLQTPSAVILEPPQNKVCYCFHCFPV